MLKALLLCAAIFSQHPGVAATDAAVAEPTTEVKTLRVDVHPVTGMCIQKEDKYWDGLEVRYVRAVARQLGYQEIEFREVAMDQKLTGVIAGEADLSIGAITVSLERECLGDFTFPHFACGYAVAVRERAPNLAFRAVEIFLKLVLRLDFWLLIGGLVVFVTVSAFVLNWTERGYKSEGEKVQNSWGDWVWWTFATIVQTEPGQVVPRSFWGRTFAVSWMLVFLLFTVSVGGAIFSSLIDSAVTRTAPELDLNGKHVATKRLSTSVEMAHQKGATVTEVDTIAEALNMLETGEVDAVVYDSQPLQQILSGWKSQSGYRLALRQRFGVQYYAAFVADNSELKEAWDREILRISPSEVEQWQKMFLQN